MCGRFTEPGDIDIIKRFDEQFRLRVGQAPAPQLGDPASPPAPHETVVARPYNNVWVVIADKHGDLRVTGMYWQLIHYWCKDFKSDYTSFNTRIESLAKKHNVELIERRRCIFPALSFFETKKTATGETVKPREAYEFTRAGGGLIPLGGIYTAWHDPHNRDDRRYSCSIITLQPNEIVGEVHPRMPFIVPDDLIGDWLDHGLSDFDRVLRMIEPAPSEILVREKELPSRASR